MSGIGEPLYSDYPYLNGGSNCSHEYLLPVVKQYLADRKDGCRALDIGCGNGSLTAAWARQEWEVHGVDLSESGIQAAKASFPQIMFHVADITGDLVSEFGCGTFDIAVSTEVVEHLYNPRMLVKNAFALLKPGGIFLVSTPYHGYLKNVAVAIAGKSDWHHTALWDGGHIKFWSPRTLAILLNEGGFRDIKWRGAGRLPYLWKSMVMRATRPIAEVR